MKKKESVIVLTLGCAKNVVDSEKLIARLISNGIDVTFDLNKADTCIINTCGFIKPSVEENLGVLLEVINRKIQKKLKRVIVFGCLVERFKENLIKEFPEVDYFIGVENQELILKYLNENIELKENLIGERYLLTPRHFAYLKISEGCNRECSFCTIPIIRGKLKSKPIKDLVEEVKYLESIGVKELVIISQDTSSYGIDLYSKSMLIDLLRELVQVSGIHWIRLMYLYPAGLPNNLIDFVANENKICNYFDIPIQHISDTVLKSMRRGTSKKNIIELIEKIRRKIPNSAIRTTLIVGYPNETEKDFLELIKFLEDYELDRVGVFTYSAEDGTSSFLLGDPIPEDEKLRRRDAIFELQRNISLKKNRELVGKNIKVIIDEVNNGIMLGRTEFDAPEVDNLVHVKVKGRKYEPGDFVDVKVVKSKTYDIFAEI
ncbi:MAG: 30S ribosomal protein S12 methylthiotransferase RimO [Ignavibacteria bacterium]|nr:30S ribosomal protein S12 methylthiotransferase RimO [Ignavibacteria bacterium]